MFGINCQVCLYLTKGNKSESSITKKQYIIKFPFRRNSRNAMYLLTCTR